VYRLYRFLRLVPILTVLGLCLSCSKPGTNLVQIQQQRSGDYSLALFNDNGVVKQHSNRLVLEVRNASTNEPADVNNLQVQASMRMPGMGPMFGTMSTMRKTGPGRYEFDAEFSMAGQWSCLVTFDPNGRAQFNLNAQ
jgi:YtkA-like protein